MSRSASHLSPNRLTAGYVRRILWLLLTVLLFSVAATCVLFVISIKYSMSYFPPDRHFAIWVAGGRLYVKFWPEAADIAVRMTAGIGWSSGVRQKPYLDWSFQFEGTSQKGVAVIPLWFVLLFFLIATLASSLALLRVHRSLGATSTFTPKNST